MRRKRELNRKEKAWLKRGVAGAGAEKKHHALLIMFHMADQRFNLLALLEPAPLRAG